MNTIDTLPIVFLNHTHIEDSLAIVHTSYDVVYVLSGSLSIVQNETKALYSVSDICLLPKGRSYRLEAAGENAVIHMGISSHFFEQYLGSYGTYICDSVLEPNNNYTLLKQLVSNIAAKYLENPEYHALSIHGLLFQLLDQIKKENAFLLPIEEQVPIKYNERIKTIIQYIDEHYQEPLSLKSLSDALFLSPQYLSKFFKKYLHKNFKEYLLEKRIFHAYRDVCYTDDPITDIAIHHGFSDITAFSKAFRSYYDTTPGKYRRQKQAALLQEEYDSIEKKDISSNPAFEKDIPINQLTPVSNLECTPFPNHFSQMINIGSVKNLLHSNFRSRLLESRSSLSFSYLRMQGIISSAFIPKVLPHYEYYFLDVGNVFDFLFKHDFIPFIELTRLPYNTYVSGAYNTESTSLTKNHRYFELLEAFLEYCAATYPLSYTGKWKFEIWKSPKESAAQYAADFIRIRSLINRYLPGASIGGPGLEGYMETTGLSCVLKELSVSGAKPDFISANFSIVTEPVPSRYMFSPDRDILPKQAREISALIHRYFNHLPFYITEWNSVFIPNTPIQYSCFQSAFICKTALELNLLCDMMGYWIFCDTTLQQDPSCPKRLKLWGRGLLNTDEIRMPSFYAFLFLNQLGDKLLKMGKNYCITQKGENHYQILAFHYAYFSPSVVINADAAVSFSETYKLFEPVPKVSMEFTLCPLPAGTYRITRHLLDRAHGSILDLWIGGFASSNVDELEYLMNIKQPQRKQEKNFLLPACLPESRTIYQRVEQELTINTTLYAHNVCLWDIIRLV